ncbi:hypothetical protein GOL75_25600 [Sinorhizobium medicae]|nr:hypothetical protein [Sinorhizobium medicae]MDX0907191.1 hypothetical protein [Sinorhizobium medicae]MDX1164632.1 hypothetical protein [Sinorhizobium medicae]
MRPHGCRQIGRCYNEQIRLAKPERDFRLSIRTALVADEQACAERQIGASEHAVPRIPKADNAFSFLSNCPSWRGSPPTARAQSRIDERHKLFFPEDANNFIGRRSPEPIRIQEEFVFACVQFMSHD